MRAGHESRIGRLLGISSMPESEDGHAPLPAAGGALTGVFLASLFPPLAASFCLAFCLALFVVDRTAVGTFDACVVAPFVTGGG